MAETAVFFGTIHPQGDGLSYEEPLHIEFHDGSSVEVVLHHGHFQARVVMDGISADPSTFLNQLNDIVQAMVDALGFHLGIATSVEIDGGHISPNTAVLATRHIWPEAVGRSPEDPLWIDGSVLQPFALAATTMPLVRYALADIRMALRQPNDTAFYAYRACESVRQWFQDVEPPTDDRSAGWERLRQALGVDESELMALAKLTRERRHGGATPLSQTERIFAISLARRVLTAMVRHVGSS